MSKILERRLAQVENAPPFVINVAAITLTARDHANRTCLLDRAAGSAVTLPSATGSGARFRFLVLTAASSGSYVIRGDSTDGIFGNAVQLEDGGNTMGGFEAAGSDDTVTLNGTTTGGVRGDIVEFEDIGTNMYHVRYLAAATGIEATPFSNT